MHWIRLGPRRKSEGRMPEQDGRNGVGRTFLAIVTTLATAATMAIAAFTVRTSVQLERVSGQIQVLSVQLSDLRARYHEQRVQSDRMQEQIQDLRRP